MTDRHEGWIEPDDNTYIFSILRDPVKFACSMYAHGIMQKAGYMQDSLVNETEHIHPDVTDVHLDKNIYFFGLKQTHG